MKIWKVVKLEILLLYYNSRYDFIKLNPHCAFFILLQALYNPHSKKILPNAREYFLKSSFGTQPNKFALNWALSSYPGGSTPWGRASWRVRWRPRGRRRWGSCRPWAARSRGAACTGARPTGTAAPGCCSGRSCRWRAGCRRGWAGPL